MKPKVCKSNKSCRKFPIRPWLLFSTETLDTLIPSMWLKAIKLQSPFPFIYLKSTFSAPILHKKKQFKPQPFKSFMLLSSPSGQTVSSLSNPFPFKNLYGALINQDTWLLLRSVLRVSAWVQGHTAFPSALLGTAHQLLSAKCTLIWIF